MSVEPVFSAHHGEAVTKGLSAHISLRSMLYLLLDEQSIEVLLAALCHEDRGMVYAVLYRYAPFPITMCRDGGGSVAV